jgi:hypothetical protein
MKMQVRHVHAGIHRASLRGLGRKIIAVRDFEDVTRGSADQGSYLPAVESERIPAIFIDCMQRKRYDVILRSNLWRLWQRNGLGPNQGCEEYLHTDG